jgi:hypothetical protein
MFGVRLGNWLATSVQLAGVAMCKLENFCFFSNSNSLVKSEMKINLRLPASKASWQTEHVSEALKELKKRGWIRRNKIERQTSKFSTYGLPVFNQITNLLSRLAIAGLFSFRFLPKKRLKKLLEKKKNFPACT